MNIQYPYLPQDRKILYVNRSNPFMKVAREECFLHSTDDKQPTGAAIVLGGQVIGVGSDQSKLKNPFLKLKHEHGWCVRKIFKIRTGEKYWLCPGCSGYDDHAEARAIMAAKNNNAGNIIGSDIYLWGHWWCCKPCWDKIIASGIDKVYLLEESEIFFNRSNPKNLLGRKNFSKFSN